MIAYHIDENCPHIQDEIRMFENEYGRINDFITNEKMSFCNHCGQRCGAYDKIHYVITAKDSVIWWHETCLAERNK